MLFIVLAFPGDFISIFNIRFFLFTLCVLCVRRQHCVFFLFFAITLLVVIRF